MINLTFWFSFLSRYFLLREGTPHSDGNFSVKKMTNYLNSELANTLGNLLNRTTSKSVNVEQVVIPKSDYFLRLKKVDPY